MFLQGEIPSRFSIFSDVVCLQKCDLWEQRILIHVITALYVHLSGLEFSGMYWCTLPACFSLALNSVI